MLCVSCVFSVLTTNTFYYPQANDYVSGEGVNFYDRSKFLDAWTNQTIGRKEQKYSLIAFATADNEEKIKAYPDAIDMLGDFPEAEQGMIADDTTMFEGVDKLEEILELGQLRPMRNAENGLFLKSMMPLNTVMFRGHTKRAKSSTSPFVVTEGGRGHWGANVGVLALNYFCLTCILLHETCTHSNFVHTNIHRSTQGLPRIELV